MRKKRFFVSVASILLVGLFLMFRPNASLAKPIELIFAHSWPALHPQHVGVLVPWAKKIEEGTNGAVKIKFLVAGAIAKSGQTYTTVEKGLADIGAGICDYTPGRFPLTSVIALPYMSDSGVQGTDALWRTYEKVPEFQQEYADTKLLCLSTHYPGVVGTVKKPIEKMEDIAGMKIKTANWITNDALKIFKAIPVTMTIDDTFMSLERGVLDGVISSTSALVVFKMTDLINYITQVDFYRVVFFVTMNKDKYNSLPNSVKKVIDENSGLSFSLDLAKSFDETEKKMDGVFLKKGVKRTIFSKPEEERIRSLTTPIKEKWLAGMADKGLPGQLVLDTVSGFLKK